MFVIYALDNSSTQHVSNCCVQFYTAEEQSLAKVMLWDIVDPQIIGRHKKRTDGSTPSKEEALANDITDALKKLDAASATPAVAVDLIGLNRIPTFTPAGTDSIFMCQKLVAMEARLKSFQETLSDNVIRTITIQDKVNNMTSYANAVQAMPHPTSHISG